MKKIKTTWVDPISMKYHLKQWDKTKESTKDFYEFIKDYLNPENTIIDIGSGAGSVTAYLAKKKSKVNFIGVEYEEKLVKLANTISKKKSIKNVTFELGNMFNLSKKNNIDGVISLQTISWVDNFEKPLKQIFNKLNPNWVAITGLFYQGDISCRVEVEEFTKGSRKVYYNTYSIPAVERFCLLFNYKISIVEPFNLSIDLKKPKNLNILGTYTEKVKQMDSSFKRIQISGPLLLNWHTILIEKNV